MAQKLVPDPERVVANIEAAFPAPQKMDRFFGFETQLFQIAVPERLGLDMVAMADHQRLMLARQQAAQRTSQQIHGGVERFVADCVAALNKWTRQEFVAGDQTDYEEAGTGAILTPAEIWPAAPEPYLPFAMRQPDEIAKEQSHG